MLGIVMPAHRSSWISGWMVLGARWLPSTAWPQTRKSTPAFFIAWISAILGLSTPLLRFLYSSLIRMAGVLFWWNTTTSWRWLAGTLYFASVLMNSATPRRPGLTLSGLSGPPARSNTNL